MAINYQMPRQLEGFQGDDIRPLTLNVDKKLKEKQTKPWFWVQGQATQRSWEQKIKKFEKIRILTLECQRNINWKTNKPKTLNALFRKDQDEGAWNVHKESKPKFRTSLFSRTIGFDQPLQSFWRFWNQLNLSTLNSQGQAARRSLEQILKNLKKIM